MTLQKSRVKNPLRQWIIDSTSLGADDVYLAHDKGPESQSANYCTIEPFNGGGLDGAPHGYLAGNGAARIIDRWKFKAVIRIYGPDAPYLMAAADSALYDPIIYPANFTANYLTAHRDGDIRHVPENRQANWEQQAVMHLWVCANDGRSISFDTIASVEGIVHEDEQVSLSVEDA